MSEDINNLLFDTLKVMLILQALIVALGLGIYVFIERDFEVFRYIVTEGTDITIGLTFLYVFLKMAYNYAKYERIIT